MDSKDPSPVPTSGIVILALILGAFYLNEPTLQGSRPAQYSRFEPAIVSPERVPARLWQDPFETVRKHLDTGIVSVEAPITKQGPAYCDPLDRLFRNDLREDVLAVMVPGSPYPADRERRIRARYAVLSGIARLGYEARDSAHLGCVLVPENGSAHVGATDVIPYERFVLSAPSTPQAGVLLLWLDEDQFKEAFLLELEKVVSQLHCPPSDVCDVAAGPPTHPFKLIGPAGSDSLRLVARKLVGLKKQDKRFTMLRGMEIYSPAATAMESELLGDAEADTTSGRISNLWHEKLGVRFTRTTGTDRDLVYALQQEFRRRGIDPSNGGDEWHLRALASIMSGRDDPPAASLFRDHMVLISEWDTLYGRALPKAFIEVFAGQTTHPRTDAGPPNSAESERSPRIHQFTYMRGLDGRSLDATQATKPVEPEKTAPKKSSPQGGAQLSEESQRRRPQGEGQYDYLRRLAHRIEGLEISLRREHQGHIRAIGVLGSDVYDKLLILQALRERFPDALFFTTDLDALYLHPREYPHTRNLVVGSNFGFDLVDSLQGGLPPFRGTYQTARYLSTLLALAPDSRPGDCGYGDPALCGLADLRLRLFDRDPASVRLHDAVFQPRIFEIGRGDAINLSPEGNRYKSPTDPFGVTRVEFQIHPQVLRDFPTWDRVLLWFSAVTLVLLIVVPPLLSYYGMGLAVLRQRGSDPKTAIKAISVAAYIFILLVYLVIPLEWLWTYRMGVLLLVLWLILYRAYGKRGPFWERLDPSRLPALGIALWVVDVVLVFFVVKSYSDTLVSLEGEPWLWATGVSMWPAEIIRVLAGVLAIYLLFRVLNDLEKSDHELSQSQSWLCRDHRKPSIPRSRWCVSRSVQRHEESPSDEATLWCDYHLHRRLTHRWKAVGLPAYLFFVAGCIGIYWLDNFHIPYRGETILRIDDMVTLGFAVPLFLILLFTVIDETRLCVGWIYRLVGDGPRYVSLTQHTPAEQSWKKLHLIAERTEPVGRIIYYPFVVLFVILLSQSSYFDHWDIAVGLMVIVGLSLSYAFACGIALRHAAERVRNKVLSWLGDARTRRLACGKDTGELDGIIEQISQLRTGAFRPWTHQPLLKAALWILGSAGVISIQYANMANF